MRLLAPLLILLLIPCAIATEGWYYAGDTFESDGIVYSVEGTSHENVLLGVGGRLHLIALYECRQEGLSEYCYTDTAYPSDDAHTKYSAGERLYGYKLSIVSAKPTLSVSRELSDDTPSLGQDVTVTVTIDNTGDYLVQQLLYKEPIPEGLDVRSGAGNPVTNKRASLTDGEEYKFTYKVRPGRFGTFTLQPTLTYTYEGVTFNTSIAAEKITVETPLSVDRWITPSLNLDETGRYEVNLTNDDQTETLRVDLSIGIPQGMVVKTVKGLEKGKNLTASAELLPEESVTYAFEFTTTEGGSLSVPATVAFTATDTRISETYTSSVTSKGSTLTPTITLSQSKDVFYAGTELTFSGVLENENDEVKFNTIKGALTSPLFEDVTFSHESFPPSRKLTEATARVTLPAVNGSTPFTIDFKGSYNSPGGRILEFTTSKAITVLPRTHAVDVTRVVEPATPAPGENVTVKVTLKNAYGQYITFDAHEKYPGDLVKASGLTFAEGSLERDASQQVYLYQLEIPANYTGERFNVTTVVKVKELPLPEEYSTEIALRDAPVAQEGQEAAPAPAEVVVDDAGEKEELGFFASIWDFVKRLFD